MIKYFLTSSSALLALVMYASAAQAGTYNLCVGEYFEPQKGKCPQGQPYAYCGADPAVEGAKLCKQEGSTAVPQVVQLSTVPGNKCGYTYFAITCK